MKPKFSLFAVQVALRGHSTPYEAMILKLERELTSNLRIIWNCLAESNWTSEDRYNADISMDTWANAVYSELQTRTDQ